MKPRNHPMRKLRRQLMANWRAGADLTPREREFCCEPKDAKIRAGRTLQMGRRP